MSLAPYWQSEEHGLRIYCGDCREVMARLEAAGERFDLVFADPPFGIAYTGHGTSADGRGHKFEPIHGDNAVNATWMASLPTATVCAVYVKTTWAVYEEWRDAVQEQYSVRAVIVWDKCSHVAGDVCGGYAGRTELLIYATAGNAKLNVFDSDVWRIPRATTGPPERRTGHPYESPVMLPARAIENSTARGARILDPFLGSGTTLVAAYRLGRHATGIEISEEYCELAARRLEQELAQGRLFEPAEVAQPRQESLLEVGA